MLNRHHNISRVADRRSIRYTTMILGTTALGLLNASLFSTPAVACGAITTLTNGTNANATTVMDNFNTIRNCVNTLESGGTIASPTLTGTIVLPGSGRILSSGQLGLGMTPTNMLDITQTQNGGSNIKLLNSSAGTSAYAALLLENGTTATSLLQFGSGWTTAGVDRQNGARLNTGGAGGLSLGTSVSQPIYLYTAATERMRIDSAGNVGIGTTSPSQKLDVNGQVRVGTFATAAATTVCHNANVLSSCSSSIRYKENVHDAAFGLEHVLKMRPVTFKWKGRNENDVGLIAEEIEKIDPLLVTYQDGKLEGVKYPQLTVVLANAVKELKAANDNQAVEIETLQRQVSELRQSASIQPAGDENFFQRVASVMGWK